MTALQSFQIVNNTMHRPSVRYGEDSKTADFTKVVFRPERATRVGTTAHDVTLQTSAILFVHKLDPSVQVLKPFEILLEPIGDGFVASFIEANINASGDTTDEALDNLAFMIRDLYLLFSEEKDRLGPEPARQYSILQNHISL